jgi:FkbM family methyltransferase
VTSLIVRLYTYIFGREVFHRWNRFLFRLSIGGLGILNYRDANESGEKEFLKKHLANRDPGSCVVDVGANKGLYSKMCLDIDPDIRIFAIEPHPVTFETLVDTLQGTRAIPVNVAMGDRAGTLSLYDHSGADGSMHASVYKEVIEDIHGSKSVSHEVRVTTIDDFMAKESIESLVLLKIDVEGHDLSVLEGARRAIERKQIEAIHFEFNEMNVISRVFLRDFMHILKNYDFYRLLPKGKISFKNYSPLHCELFAYQNIIAILRG